jgi:hypothetical protein
MSGKKGRRRLAKAVAAGAAALGLLTGMLSGAAEAATPQGTDRCPVGSFCLFTGADGAGQMFAYRSSTANTGWAGHHALSWANRTKYYSCIFEAPNYQWAPPPHNDGYWWTGPATSAGYGSGTAQANTAQYRDYMLSVNLAPTAHECWTREQYIGWYPVRYGGTSSHAGFGAFVTGGPSDLVMRSVEGNLWLLDGTGNATNLGVGWGGMTALVRHGDFNGDGNEDIVARDWAGNLWLYPGNGKGALESRHWMGNGWNGMTAILGVGDLTGDGHSDIVARDRSGNLWLYPGDGKGALLPRRWLGNGWNGMTAIVGVGDLTGDGVPDIVARDRAGSLWLYPGTRSGHLGARSRVATGIGQSWQLLAIGDVDGDGKNDLYAADSPFLHLFQGNGKGGLKRLPDNQTNAYVANEATEYYF